MTRWGYILFGLVVLAFVTLINLEYVNDRKDSRSWSSSGGGHGSSGGSWSSGGGGGGHK